MECLYKTSTTNTYEEYKRFSWVLYKKAYILFVVLFGVFMVIAGAVLDNIVFYAFALLMPFFETWVQNTKIKKTYKSSTIAQNIKMDFEFYEEYFIKKSEVGEDKIFYNKLSRVIETKTNFYMMIANNQGYVLCKNNFPKGLDDFLRNLKIS